MSKSKNNIYEDYLELKEQLEEKKNTLARLQGKKETLMQTLEDDFQCQTVEELQELLKKEKEILNKLENEYESKLKDFEDKYEKQLED